MKLRFFLVPALLAASLAPSAGAGEYQRTKDGKTLVWNAKPQPGDEATWFGDRDKEGYASGVGTLTWYTSKGTIYARYFGNMAHGKFNGAVNAHARGKTAHAKFVDGERTGHWVAGRAASRSEGGAAPPATAEATPKPPPPGVTLVEKPKVAAAPPVKSAATPALTPVSKAEMPAEGPTPAVAQQPPQPAPPIERTKPSPPKVAGKPAADGKKKSSFDSSLTALVGPPSSLHSVPQNTQLSQEDAIGLADAEARVQGYDLNDFQRPKADYSATTDKWTLFYEQKSADGSPQVGRHFVATVEDKTRKAVVERRVEE